jgi:trk system potassium uptake protein TrkH
MTGLFAVTTILLGVMTLLCVPFNEMGNIPGFAAGFLVSGGLALALKLAFPRAEDLELRHAMIVAAVAYILVPAVSAIPFLFIEHMSYIDSFFEAISGWTGTGFSMIMQPEKSTMTILLWRSIMQWIGGIGVIVLMVSILIRPGTSTYIMYQSEARKDRIQPSIRSTLKTIWFLYFALTVFGVIMLLAVGMPLWDSINHCMVAIGTGGFSIYSDSIAHYNSLPMECVLMFIMFYGALPFVFLYKTVKKPKSLASIDYEVKAFVLLILLGTAVLAAELYLKHRGLFESIRLSAFQLVSGITCTGLQTSMMADWSPTALLILSIAMIIGGCAGSTAGGIKVARSIFLSSELKLWMKRTLLPRNAIVTIKMGNKRLNEDTINKELAEAALISFLWIICILVSVMVLSHVVSPEYDLSKIIFTVCSSQGNVGLWCGIVEPGMHIAGKIMLMINMWIGRLEIIPVTLLIRYMFKGFKL